MTSIRRRLIIGGLLTIATVLTVVASLSFNVIQHEADEVFSARLATSARVLEAMTARQLEKATIVSPLVIELPHVLEMANQASSDDRTSQGHPYENKLAFQVWNESGNQLLARSASAPQQVLGPFTPGFHDLLNHDDSGWHVFVLKSGDVWIQTAEKSEVREEMVAEMAQSVLTPLLAGSVVLLILFNVVARFGLKPLHEVTDQIKKRQASDLQPLQADNKVSEINSLQFAINGWLDQLRSARNREQEFIRAAAHEIRTPIAAIQIHVQNAQQSQNFAEMQSSLTEAEEATRRTAKLADQLLTLSRLNASGEAVYSTDNTLLCDIVNNVVDWMKPLLSPQGINIELICDPILRTKFHPFLLERLIRNLVENAAQYGHTPGTIYIHWQRLNHAIELSVTNDGPTIPDAEKSKVFIPYYRLNSPQGRGSGLGLAIVDEMVRQMGARVWIEDKQPGPGVRVVIQWNQADWL